MRSMWIAWKWPARSRPHQRGGWPRRFTTALALALLLCLAVGAGQALTATPAFAFGGSLTIQQPNYRGVIAGPPGTKVTIQGFGWRSFSTIALSVASGANCGGVFIGNFATDRSGEFTAGFLWPLQANHIGDYRVCGAQAGYGSALSSNTFTVDASSPPSLEFSPGSLVAGDVLTVIGKNWLPGPQTVTLVVIPCNGNVLCNAAPVAQATVVTANDGTFSQQLTISASAASGTYYIHAVNSVASLSVPGAGPIQVSGQASSSGTPVPGVSPTTIATRTDQDSVGSSTPSPISQASSSLKNALMAAVLGLVALLVMIGGLAFFIGRSRGPEPNVPTKAGKGSEPPSAQSESPRRATWRTASPAASAVRQPSEARALSPYRGEAGLLDGNESPVPDEQAANQQASEDDYPWEEQIPPPAPETEPEGRGSAPRPTPGAASYPQANTYAGQLPPARRPSAAPGQFMPPRRAQRFRSSEDQREY